MENIDSAEISKSKDAMSFRDASVAWIICLGFLFLLYKINSLIESNFIIILTALYYIAAGIYLNRTVLRKVIEWHPVYNTLENISTIKLRYFLFWPVTYFFLLIRLAVYKVL